MKRNREELENKIMFAIGDIHESGNMIKVQNKACSSDLQKYFTRHKIIQIFNKNLPLTTISELDLYNISLFLVDNKFLDVNLSEYFTDDEITAAIKNEAELINEYDEKVVFRNMEYNNNEIKPQFVGFMEYSELGKLMEAGVLNYNFATQRKAKIVKYRNRVERIPTISENNVSEIRQEILDNLFEENTITLNIRIADDKPFIYDEETKKLVLNTDAIIDVVDGYHRLTAIHDAWKSGREIKGSMVVLIKHIDISKARYFIAQESKGTVNNQDEMRLYDSSSNLSKLINYINTNKNTMLFNRITTGNNLEDTLMLYDIFAYSMDRAWSEKLSKTKISELREISEFISEFYDMVYENIMAKIGVEKIDELKNTIMLDQMFMAGLVFPALKMYESNDGKVDISKIKKMINKICGDNDDYTYENQKDSYEIKRYIKAWEKAI